MTYQVHSQKSHQHGQTWIFVLLTMCFTLCGAASCLGLDNSPKTWTDMVTAGNTALKNGDNATAEKMFSDAEKTCADKKGKNSNERATCLNYLAELYRDEQEYRKAALVYKELINVKEVADPNGADLATYREHYAEIEAKLKEYGLETDPNAPALKKEEKDGKDKEKSESKDKSEKEKEKDKDKANAKANKAH